jgi:hypothetical protein
MPTSRAEHRHLASPGATHDDPSAPSPDPRSTTPGRASSRRPLRLLLAAITLSLGGAGLYVASAGSASEPAAVVGCPQAASSTVADPACDGLWDRIRVLGLPEHEWAATAQAMGLFLRDGWISDDGLRWEHLDGRSYTVATPQRNDDRRTSGS